MNASVQSIVLNSPSLAAAIQATIDTAKADGLDIAASEAWDAITTSSGDPLLTVIGQHAVDLDEVEVEIHYLTRSLVYVAQRIDSSVRRGEHIGPADSVSTTARELDRAYLRRDWLARSLRSAVGMWNAKQETPETKRETVVDLGGPDGGRYWRVVSGETAEHPDALAAAIHARAGGSVGATYNDVRVERIDGREPGYTDSDRKHDELRAALADADEVRRGSTREQDRRDHDDTDR